MKKILFVSFLFFYSVTFSQNKQYAERLVESIMQHYPDSIVVKKMASHLLQDNQIKAGQNVDEINANRPATWNYETGVLLMGIERLWQSTNQEKYYHYLQHITDKFIESNGNIKSFVLEEYNADFIPSGRQLLTLYKNTNAEKYKLAADLLRKQIEWQPRNKSGGFWHKLKYPTQMWLDGLYMMEPFYASYAAMNKQWKDFDDIVFQFVLMEKTAKDTKTGLLYHGWDESKMQKWANQKTGQSPEFWSRAMGWYLMGLVDVLDEIPKNHAGRKTLIGIYQRTILSILQYQDAKTGVWWQITDKANQPGNYLESSASAMFVYSIAKGIRLNYLPTSYIGALQRGMEGLVQHFIQVDSLGAVHYNQAVSGAGLGGNPYRDGSYTYYINEPKRNDDLKAIGPFIQACIESDAVLEKSIQTIK